MPTLDTNVLVRLLVADDSRQVAQAEALIDTSTRRNESLFLPLTVMLELEWILRARYDFDKATVLETLVELLETRELEFQDEATVERALFLYQSANADFAECMHLAAAMTADRRPLLSFDRGAARLEGAELIM